jgi:NAD(P)H-dependent FMN reductase
MSSTKRAKELVIVGLCASPRRGGNTEMLMSWVLEGCEARGARTEWIRLAEHRVEFCTGCETCLVRGDCVLEDDVAALTSRLERADAIVVGSPVYSGQPTAQLKALIDRLTLHALYVGKFENQPSIGVATSGIAPTASVARQIGSFFGVRSATLGARTASLRRGYHPLSPRTHPRLHARARRTGHRLVQDVRSPSWFRMGVLKRRWVQFLRRQLMPHLVTRHPERFAWVLKTWRERGWIADPEG